MPGKADPFDNLVFEVNCLGCGHVAFSLPYREGTHHTMTCHRCGEVTIAHVLPGGNVAVATFDQRAAALERIKRDVERALREWDAVVEEQLHDEANTIPLPHRRTDYEGDTLRLTAMSDSTDLMINSYADYAVYRKGVLEVRLRVDVRLEGLLLKVSGNLPETRASFARPQDRSGILVHLARLSPVLSFDGTLLVEPRVPASAPKDTAAT